MTEAGSGLGLLAGLECTIWGDRSEAFDVILADIQMPDLTALEALEASVSPGLDTPIVLMTAYGDADVRAEAQRLGAIAVLDKPLDWGRAGQRRPHRRLDALTVIEVIAGARRPWSATLSLTQAYFALQLLAFGIGLALKAPASARRSGTVRSCSARGRTGGTRRLVGSARAHPAVLLAGLLGVAAHGNPVADGARGALGLVLSGVGTAFTVASIFLMGRACRNGIDPSNRSELAEDGPYRWIRHPIYSGMLLVAVGNALLIPHPAVFAVAAASCLGFAFQARREEDHLRRTFGERYTRYMARTGRFAPRLRAPG